MKDNVILTIGLQPQSAHDPLPKKSSQASGFQCPGNRQTNTQAILFTCIK